MFSDSHVWGGVNFDDVLRGESTSVEWGGLALPTDTSGSSWVQPPIQVLPATAIAPTRKKAMCSAHPSRVAEYWHRKLRSTMCGRCLLAGGASTQDLVAVEDAVIEEANAALTWLQHVLTTLGPSPVVFGTIVAAVHRAELSPDDLRLCNAALPALQSLNTTLHDASLIVAAQGNPAQSGQLQPSSISGPPQRITAVAQRETERQPIDPQPTSAQQLPQPAGATIESHRATDNALPDVSATVVRPTEQQTKKFVVPKPRSRMLLEGSGGAAATSDGLALPSAPIAGDDQPPQQLAAVHAKPPPPPTNATEVTVPAREAPNPSVVSHPETVTTAVPPPADVDPVSPLSYLDAIRTRTAGGTQRTAPGDVKKGSSPSQGHTQPLMVLRPTDASQLCPDAQAKPNSQTKAPQANVAAAEVRGTAVPGKRSAATAPVGAVAHPPGATASGKQKKRSEATSPLSATSPPPCIAPSIAAMRHEASSETKTPQTHPPTPSNCRDSLKAGSTAINTGSSDIVELQDNNKTKGGAASSDEQAVTEVGSQPAAPEMPSPGADRGTANAADEPLSQVPAQNKGSKVKSKQVVSASQTPPMPHTKKQDAVAAGAAEKKKQVSAATKPSAPQPKPKSAAVSTAPRPKATKKKKWNAADDDDELLEAVLAQHTVDELEQLRGPFRVFPGVAVPLYPTLLSMIEPELKVAPPLAQKWLRDIAVAVHDEHVRGKDPSAVHRLMEAKQGRYPSALDLVLDTYTFYQFRGEPYWRREPTDASTDAMLCASTAEHREYLRRICDALSLQSKTSSIHGVPSAAEFVAGVDLTSHSVAPDIDRRGLIAALACYPHLLAMNMLLFDLTTSTQCGSIMRFVRWLLPTPLGMLNTPLRPNPSDHLVYAAVAYHYASFGAVAEAERWLQRIHVASVLPYDRVMFLRFYCLACMRLGHAERMRAALPRLSETSWYITHWFLIRYALMAYMDDTSRNYTDTFAHLFSLKNGRPTAEDRISDESDSYVQQYNELRAPIQLSDILARSEWSSQDARHAESAYSAMVNTLSKINEDPCRIKIPLQRSYEMVVSIVAKADNPHDTMWKRQNLEAAEWFLEVNFKMLWAAVMTSGTTFQHGHAQLVLLRVNPVTALDHCLASKASVMEVGCSVNPDDQSPADMQQSITIMTQLYERWSDRLFQVPGLVQDRDPARRPSRTVVEYYLQTVSATKTVTLFAKSRYWVGGDTTVEAAGQVALPEEALLVLFTDSALITALGNDMHRAATSAWREVIPIGSMRIASLAATARHAHPDLYERTRTDLRYCLQVCFDLFVGKLAAVLDLPALKAPVAQRRDMGSRSELLVIGRGLIDALPFHAFEDARSGMHLMELCVLSRGPSTFLLAGQCALRTMHDASINGGRGPLRAEVLSVYDASDPTLQTIMQHCPAGSRSRSFAPKQAKHHSCATPLITHGVEQDALQMDSMRPSRLKPEDTPNPALLTVLMSACNKSPIYVIDAPVAVSAHSNEHAPWHIWDGRNRAVSHGTGKELLASGDLDDAALVVCTRNGVGLPSGSPMLPEHQIGLHRALLIAGAQRVLLPWRFAAEYVDSRSLPVMQAAMDAAFPRSCGVSRAVRHAMMALKDAGEPLNVWSAFSFYGLD